MRVNGNLAYPMYEILFINQNLEHKYALLTIDLSNFDIEKSIKITNDSAGFLGLISAGNYRNGHRLTYLTPFSRFVLPDSIIICYNQKVTLHAGVSPNGYYWNTGDTTPKILVNKEGTYKVRTQWNGCNREDSVIIKNRQSITDILDDTVLHICAGNKVNITSSKLDNLKNFVWNNGIKSKSYVAEKTELIKIKGSDAYDCSIEDSIWVIAHHVPKIEILTYPETDSEYCINRTIKLKPSIFSDTLTYTWSTGEKSYEIEKEINSITSYNLTIQNKYGCTSSAYLTVNCSAYLGKIPNIITPNNDGYNDKFIIENYEPGTWSLKIFNRYGSLVWEDKEYQNNFNGELLPPSIYFYILQHRFSDKFVKGFLEIKK
jgi:gliding motility-associated-like protein